MPYVKMRTLRTSHSRAIVKIIQDKSLPRPLEICENRFEVNNEQHDFRVSYIIATKRIFWLCTKIFSNTRHSFKIMNLCAHYIIFMACNKGRNKLQFFHFEDKSGHNCSINGYICISMVSQKLPNT
jgi:hypothetical protein